MTESQKGKQPSSFLIRCVYACILIALLVACFLLGRVTFCIFVAVCLLLALHEELNVLTKAGNAPVRWISFAGLIVSIPIILFTKPIMVIPYISLLTFCALFCIMRRKEPKLTDLLFTMLPLLSIVLPGACLFGLFAIEDDIVYRYLYTLTLAMPVLCDTFAYLVGSALHGPKLCPAISPKKTIAGAIGGMAGSILAAVVTTLCFQNFGTADLLYPPMWAVIGCGVLAGIASQIGDLLASMIKRHCGVKDFSNLIPGHGGMMDRIDSILLAVVIVYSYRLLFFA